MGIEQRSTTMPSGPVVVGGVTCVVLAHNDPPHVARLLAALDPFPVVLHCDARTPRAAFDQMLSGARGRCVPVYPRRVARWAQWDIVAAELDAYRIALEVSDAQHIVVMAGSDYPLASTADIQDVLAAHAGKSVCFLRPMPLPDWGRTGGTARLRYRHWAWNKHMVRLPLPRRLPRDIVTSGGSVQKVLSRQHVRQLLDIVDSRPDLVRFWRRTWAADETFIPSLLLSPELGIDWASQHVQGRLWRIGWDGTRRKSPAWLTLDRFDWLKSARDDPAGPVPAVFARKFSTARSTELLDRIDVELRRTALTFGESTAPGHRT